MTIPNMRPAWPRSRGMTMRRESLPDALPLYEQALNIDEDALGENHPDTLAIANDLAFLKIELRQPDDATRLAHDVAEAQQNMLNGVFTFAPEHQRMDFERTIEPWDLPGGAGRCRFAGARWSCGRKAWCSIRCWRMKRSRGPNAIPRCAT